MFGLENVPGLFPPWFTVVVVELVEVLVDVVVELVLMEVDVDVVVDEVIV